MWPDPGELCASAKMRAVGQEVKGRLQCYARAILHGAGPDAACLNQVANRFATRWAKIEAFGGCATTGDEASLESDADVFVSDVVARLPSATSTTTSTTVTATSSCPSTTALYCGISACGGPGGFNALCPTGMTCTDPANGCACVGDPIPCGDLHGAFCRWGTCPAGMSCGTDPNSVGCPPSCACH
jgi:hypothetical protein